MLFLMLAGMVLIWGIAIYNALVRLRNQYRESWSGIDTELKRRYDLIPRLVETVQGYVRHEAEVLRSVTEARNHALASTGSPATQAKDENVLIGSMRALFGVVEQYPDLKANQNFLQLQSELVNTEDRIQAARRFYNANVRELNTRIEVFPSNLVAGLFRFPKVEYFDIEEASIRQAPPITGPGPCQKSINPPRN